MSSNPPVASFAFDYRGAPYLGRVIYEDEDMGDIEVVPEFLASIHRAWEDPEAYGIDYDMAEAYAFEAVLRANADGRHDAECLCDDCVDDNAGDAVDAAQAEVEA